jgi:hypothetical protein
VVDGTIRNIRIPIAIIIAMNAMGGQSFPFFGGVGATSAVPQVLQNRR